MAMLVMVSCAESTDEKIERAASVVDSRPDSALIELRSISYPDLKSAEMMARFAMVKALANNRTGRSLVNDTLLPQAVEHYRRADDSLRWAIASQLLASHYYALGRRDEANAQVDSVLAVTESPEMQWDVHKGRLDLAFSEQDYATMLTDSDWLLNHTSRPEDRLKASQIKMAAYYFMERMAEAAALGDSIAKSDFMPERYSDEWASFMNDYAHILDGVGRTHEALDIMRDIVDNTIPESKQERVSRLLSCAQLYASAGDIAEAKRCMEQIDEDVVKAQPESYIMSAIIKSVILYKETGKIHVVEMYEVPKNVDMAMRRAWRDRETAIANVYELDRDKYMLVVERQRMWIVLLVLAVCMLAGAGIAVYMVRRRRQRLIEAEERVEALTEMLKTVEKADTHSRDAVVKRLVLRQLGILKTFAGAPTSQNQDALRKISVIGHDEAKAGALVDWPHLFSMIDELYDGFHSRLLDRYPGLFNDRETEIIVLIKAGFSTKEISVLTEQSSATIYVRKTAIRKKLGTEANGDFMARIEEDLTR